jgi:hypothetical protein
MDSDHRISQAPRATSQEQVGIAGRECRCGGTHRLLTCPAITGELALASSLFRSSLTGGPRWRLRLSRISDRAAGLMIFDGSSAARGERTHKPMRADGCVRTWRRPVTGRADRWIRRTTIGCAGLLALIAGTVSYLHMHLLVERHGQPGWVAVLTPLSVDGMIVAAPTTLLADSRGGGRGTFLPWALLAVGGAANLAANVAVAEPTTTGRVIAAWPSFSLIAAYELLMRRCVGLQKRGRPVGGRHQARYRRDR